MARLGYILAGVIILVLSSFFLFILLNPINDVDVVEAGLVLCIVMVVLLIIHPILDKFRKGTPLIPDELLDTGGGTLWFGFISIWIGNLVALVPVTIIALQFPRQSQGLMVGFPIGIAAIFYWYGFDAIGSAKRKWQEDKSEKVDRHEKPYRGSGVLGITVGLGLFAIGFYIYLMTGEFGGLMLLSMIIVAFGLFNLFR